MNSAVAIINWNSGNLLRTCIESLLATTTNAEILVIDNASTDAALESVEGFRNRVDFIQNSVNRGFAAAVNQAFQTTSTSYVLILNPDIRVLPGAVQLLDQFMENHPRAGAVGGFVGEQYLPREFPSVGGLVLENLGFGIKNSPPQMRRGGATASGLTRRGGVVQEIDQHHPSRGCASAFPSSTEEGSFSVDQPAAAALMIRRDAYDDAGGFDEQFYPAWYEDVDFCLRIKALGWEIFFVPAAEFLHTGGYSAGALGSESFVRAYYSNQMRYARKHFGSIGSAAVRASIAAGMIGRMIGRPREAKAYGKAFIGALKGW